MIRTKTGGSEADLTGFCGMSMLKKIPSLVCTQGKGLGMDCLGTGFQKPGKWKECAYVTFVCICVHAQSSHLSTRWL